MRKEATHRQEPQAPAAPPCSPLPDDTFFNHSQDKHKVSLEINLSRVPPVPVPLWTQAATALALLGLSTLAGRQPHKGLIYCL